MKDLSFRGVPSLAIAVDATTPTAPLGSLVWSTTVGKLLVWDGSKWAEQSSGSGGGDVVGPSEAVDWTIPAFDGSTGKMLKSSPFCTNEFRGLGLVAPDGTTSYGFPGAVLLSGGSTNNAFWGIVNQLGVNLGRLTSVAFNSFGGFSTSTGELFYGDEGDLYFPLFDKVLDLAQFAPAWSWTNVSAVGDNNFCYISYDGYTIAVAAYSDGSLSPRTVPSGIPAPTEFDTAAAVSEDGMHFYFVSNSTIYHAASSTYLGLSSSTPVESTSISVGAEIASILIAPNGSAILVLANYPPVVYRYALSTPFSLASASGPTAISLDSRYAYGGMSYYVNDGLVLLHRRERIGGEEDPRTEVVQSDLALTFSPTAYSDRTLLTSFTQPQPQVVVSDIPPYTRSRDVIWVQP